MSHDEYPIASQDPGFIPEITTDAQLGDAEQLSLSEAANDIIITSASRDDEAVRNSNASLRGEKPAPAEPVTPVTAARREKPLRQETDEKAGVGRRIGQFFSKTWEVVTAAGDDLKDGKREGNLFKKIAYGVGALAVQAADRARVSVLVIPPVATNILKDGGSPFTAAAVSAGIFGAYSYVVGKSTEKALRQYPETVDTFAENFYSVVGVVQDSLPGLELPTEEQKRQSLIRRSARNLGLSVMRGVMDIAVGTTAYAATKVAQIPNPEEQDLKDTNKVIAQVSRDGGFAVGSVVLGIGEFIKHAPIETALKWQDWMTNMTHWYEVAGVLIAGTFSVNRVAGLRKAAKQRKAEV